MLYMLIALGFMFFAGIAMTVNEGLWSNTISLLCILISSITGAVAGVPLGVLLMKQADAADENAWFFIFAGIWAAFAVSMLLLRIVADKASKVRVRFIPLLDKIAGVLMGLFVATMLTSFAAYTLWVAPVSAGESGWRDSERVESLEKLAGTFNFVLQRFLEAEKIQSPFYGSK